MAPLVAGTLPGRSTAAHRQMPLGALARPPITSSPRFRRAVCSRCRDRDEGLGFAALFGGQS